MHFGHSESVSRGQPSGGFVFWYDLRSGLSDHLGVKEGFWSIWLSLSKTVQAAPAATVSTFSAYFIGLCINLSYLALISIHGTWPGKDMLRFLVAFQGSIVHENLGYYRNELSCLFSCLCGD